MKKTILPKKNIIAQTDKQHPFGHATVKAQRDGNKGGAKATTHGLNKPAMDKASSLVKGKAVVKKYTTSTLGK